MPYDNSIFSSPGERVLADSVSRITQILKLKKGGVCRHQAPFLTAVLKKLGFDAWQVWHNWANTSTGQIDSGHTLVYLNDPDIKCLINPGKADNNQTVIPFDQYNVLYRQSNIKATKWRYRSNSNHWQDVDWDKYM